MVRAARTIGWIAAYLLLFSILKIVAQAQPVSTLEKAMLEELAQSLKRLSSNGTPAPYFIAYRVVEMQSTVAAGAFGSLLTEKENRRRVLAVEIRVGKYDFDNTNFLSAGSTASSPNAVNALPLDDDYEQLRRCIRRATSDAYQKAVEDYEAKRGFFQTEGPSDDIPDFSREDPVVAEDLPNRMEVDRTWIERTVRELSALFRDVSDILTSRAEIVAANVETHYVNSEGTRFHKLQPWVSVCATATVQSANKQPLSDSVQAFARRWDDLPTTSELASRIRKMVALLHASERSKTLEFYQGPVLFAAEAAPQLIERSFVSELVGERTPVVDDPKLRKVLTEQREARPLLRVGTRVLPTFLSVTEDPTIDHFESNPLPVNYHVDDDGVMARNKIVVSDGTLETFLTSRTPVNGVMHSTGNRWGIGPMPANVIVEAKDGLSQEDLKQRFLELIASHHVEYGLIVRRLESPFPSAWDAPLRTHASRKLTCIGVYKLFLDGREEQIHSLELIGAEADRFKKIVAVSKVLTLVSEPMQSVLWQLRKIGDPGVVSVVAPDLIFDDLTLMSPVDNVPRSPVLSSPLLMDRDRP